MKETNDSHKRRPPAGNPWWAFLTRYLPGQTPVRPEDSHAEAGNLPISDPPTSQAHCRHFRLTKSVALMSARFLGRPVYHSTIGDLCPICGLLPKGDRRVEHVLKIWFVDGEMCEYRFRDRTWNDCHRISDHALHILLDDTVLSYSMEMVSSVTFGTRELLPDSAEVEEAERIISGRPSED